jgi:hypothetical protein
MVELRDLFWRSLILGKKGHGSIIDEEPSTGFTYSRFEIAKRNTCYAKPDINLVLSFPILGGRINGPFEKRRLNKMKRLYKAYLTLGLLMALVLHGSANAQMPIPTPPSTAPEYEMGPGATLPPPPAVMPSDLGFPAIAEPYWVWCDQLSYRLTMALQQASMMYIMGQYADGIRTVSSALQSAITPFPQGQFRLYSRILIDRALQYSQRFSLSSEPRILKTMLYFLTENLKLIIDTANHFDPQYWFPRTYCQPGVCGGAYGMGFDIATFDAALVDVARSELQLVTQSMISWNSSSGTTPVGSATVFLHVAEIATAGVSRNLQTMLSAPANACNIGALIQLNRQIRQVLNGSFSPYPSIPYAVASIANDLESIAQSLNYSPYPCRY